jgi:hypothetical protein
MESSSGGIGSKPANSAGIDEKSSGWRAVLLWLTVVLLIASALATRLPSPWRLEVTNDEQHHHLQSWRNRYRTNDVFPVFFDRLQETHQNSRQVKKLLAIYHAHPELVARSLFILIDPQPPLWPVLAETIEAISHSSLVLQRIPPLIASLAALALAYLIGKRLGGMDLGLWLSGLFTIGLLSQVYAGIARPYALAQCLVLAVIYCFILQRQQNKKSFALFLFIALLAQSSQWMAWAVIGPFVCVELFCQYKLDHSIRRLVASAWWYLIASALLLIEMAAQLRNPTISNQAHRPGLSELTTAIGWASPFSQFLVMDHRLQSLSIGLFLCLLVLSTALVLRPAVIPNKYIRAGLFLALVTSLLSPILLGATTRFLMTYLIVPTIIMAAGICTLLATQWLRQIVLGAVLLVFGVLSIIHLSRPYFYKVWSEPRFSVIANDLRSQLQPGDPWMGYPYFVADNLYRYGPLPDPLLPQSEDELEKEIHDAWRDGKSVYVLTTPNNPPAIFANEQIVKKYEDQEVALDLIKLPPTQP